MIQKNGLESKVNKKIRQDKIVNFPKMITSIDQIINGFLVGKRLRLYKTTWQVNYSDYRVGYTEKTIEFTRPVNVNSKRNYERKRVIELDIVEHVIIGISLMIEDREDGLEIQLEGYDNGHPYRTSNRDIIVTNSLYTELELVDELSESHATNTATSL